MTEDSTVTIAPARSIAGSARMPGDKSISHRYAMLAAIAEGHSKFSNFASGADCASTLACVEALGCEVRRDVRRGGNAVEIIGRGPQLTAPAGPLDCGNSGSTMRMLSGILAGQPFACELRGDASLTRRPMTRVIAPLAQMRAIIRATTGRPPPPPTAD